MHITNAILGVDKKRTNCYNHTSKSGTDFVEKKRNWKMDMLQRWWVMITHVMSHHHSHRRAYVDEVPNDNESIVTALRSWASRLLLDFALYQKCWQHKGRWALTTDYDRRTVALCLQCL